jgi:hypothetical protein
MIRNSINPSLPPADNDSSCPSNRPSDSCRCSVGAGRWSIGRSTGSLNWIRGERSRRDSLAPPSGRPILRTEPNPDEESETRGALAYLPKRMSHTPIDPEPAADAKRRELHDVTPKLGRPDESKCKGGTTGEGAGGEGGSTGKRRSVAMGAMRSELQLSPSGSVANDRE